MLRVINGKRYDTEKAKIQISAYENNGAILYHLYKKRTGEFFLFIVPNSQVNEASPRSYRAQKTKILPLTFMDAKAWAESHADPNTVRKIFGNAPKSPNSKVTVTFRLEQRKVNFVKREAAKKGQTFSEYISSLIKEDNESDNLSAFPIEMEDKQ